MPMPFATAFPSRPRRVRPLLPALLAGLAALPPVAARAADLPEYRLKAAFVYNFIVYTEWPAEVGPTLNLCIVGADPFGVEIDGLGGKAVGERRIAVLRKAAGEPLRSCQVAFAGAAAVEPLAREAERLRGQRLLTVADSSGAARQGMALNMALQQGRVSFEVNLAAVRAAGLSLSSKLLRLATEVLP